MMQVKAYVVDDTRVRDVQLDAADKARRQGYTFAQVQDDPETRSREISTVSLAYNPSDGLLYCGFTAWDNDILDTFDLDSKIFRSLNFQQVGDRFDIKIHRSLKVSGDGAVYAATAGLHDLDQRAQAAGGKLLRYDPTSGEFEVLGVPIPREYIQTIALDETRGILYGFTYPVAYAFRFDIDTRTSTDLGYVGSMPHSPVIDDAGNLWGTWTPLWANRGKACLFRYNPDSEEMTWYRKSLPAVYADDGCGIDSALNGGDGYLYFGTTAGALARLDPRTVEVTYLGHPLAGPRVSALVLGHDGLIYGSGGTHYDTHLFAYDRESGQSLVLGAIYDPQRETSNWTTHALCEPRPGLFYVGETDNPDRSGYLWECQVD
jgi:sugar lactone lactonase YvrE